MNDVNGLFHDPLQVADLRQRLGNGDAHVTGLLQRALREADQPLDTPGLLGPPDARGNATVAGEFTVASAVAYLLTGKSHYARNARRAALHQLSRWCHANLGLAAHLHAMVVAWECCADAWDQAERHAILQVMEQGSVAFFRQRFGNPHSVGNNWWAVCHTGALLSALCVHGQSGLNGAIDQAEIIDWAGGRLLAFACHFGDAGIYHEGTGYQRYAVDSLLKGLLALQRCRGVDAFVRFPQLRAMLPSMQLLACLRPVTADPDAGSDTTTALAWNDSGHGWGSSALFSIGLRIADPAQVAELRWLYDHHHGHASPGRDYSSHFGGLFHSLVHYPYDIAPKAPGQQLPLSICDSRQGLWIARNRYHDGDDCIVGAYARTTHVGGHSHADSGSIRFMALGHDWIASPGQARPDARWQSVLCPADPQDRKRSGQQGLVMWDQREATVASFAIDLRKTSGAYHERYIGVRWPDASTPFTLALLDLLDDHIEGRQWHWSWAFAPHLQCDLRDDQSGFTLIAPDATRCEVSFLGHRPDDWAVETMPDSQRSYTGGPPVNYPGLPFVRALFGPSRKLHHVYVVATVVRGVAPALALCGGGVGLSIGGIAWRRPFGASVPLAFRIGESRNLCLEPAGFEWPEDPRRA